MKSLDYYLQWGSLSVRSLPHLQYAYRRTALYCLIDERALDIAGWDAFDLLDGDLSAPECIPTGSSHSRTPYGVGRALSFVAREWEEDARFSALIDELLAERPQ